MFVNVAGVSIWDPEPRPVRSGSPGPSRSRSRNSTIVAATVRCATSLSTSCPPLKAIYPIDIIGYPELVHLADDPAGQGPVIAIVGGGASGTLAALYLLREAASRRTPLRVALIDRHGRHGLGQAYATTHPAHLLNSPTRGSPARSTRSRTAARSPCSAPA
jgi:FAD-NAD(P)-binding